MIKRYTLGKHVKDSEEACGSPVERDMWGVAEMYYTPDVDEEIERRMAKERERIAQMLDDVADELNGDIDSYKAEALEKAADIIRSME